MRSRATLDAVERAERAELRTVASESLRLRDRSIATASVGLAVLLGLIALRLVRRPCGRSSCRSDACSGSRATSARAATAHASRSPARRRPLELAQAFNATAVSLANAEAELRTLGDRHLAELDAVFREAPLGLAFVDREPALPARQRGAGPHERPAGGRARRPARCATTTCGRALREVLRSGEPVLDRELAIDGRNFLASYFPVRDGGDDFLAVGAAVIDVTDRQRAEAARERLQHATASLAAAVNVADAARATVIEARPRAGHRRAPP